MRFAVNYSLPLENLLRAEKIDIDLIKCPEWENIIQAGLKVRSCYTHNEIALGRGNLAELDFDRVKRYLDLTHTPHLNCHLWGSSPQFKNNLSERTKQKDAWMRELELLQKKIPGYRVICENLPAEPGMPAWGVSRYPDLLREFIVESGCGLLLDLSHARITAMNYGMDYQAYIAELPTGRLAELHITGIKPYGGYPEDHFEMQAEDWPPTRWAAEQIKLGKWSEPEIVAFEYGGVGDIFNFRTNERYLLEQVPLLKELFT